MTTQQEVVIVGAMRTPIGTMNGTLKDIPAHRLANAAIGGALRQAGLTPSEVEEVILGQVLQAGAGQNAARQAAIEAGIPREVPAYTVNQVCGSGLKSVHLAVQSIMSGDCEIVVCGGMESMSQAPFLLPGARQGYRLGHQNMLDAVLVDGLWCSISDCHMGETAENICDRYGLTREQLDVFALESQRKAVEAITAGRLRDEIVPISIPQRRGGETIVAEDEHPRPGTTLEALAKLRPAFRAGGRVTAGNASGINDGAAAIVMTSARRAKALGLKPLAVLRANASIGIDPEMMGMGPVPAARKALAKAGLAVHDLGLIEANEAFASQSIAVINELGLDPARVNVNGGAIALGHPIGASGARVLVTLVHEMNRRSVRYGMAALCIGGGQGIATILEIP